MMPQLAFKDVLPRTGAYFLSHATLEWADATTAIFNAALNGPKDSIVVARAWLATEAGTLAEASSPALLAGDRVTLVVRLNARQRPQFAYMRIESSPLETEHVVGVKLDGG